MPLYEQGAHISRKLTPGFTLDAEASWVSAKSFSSISTHHNYNYTAGVTSYLLRVNRRGEICVWCEWEGCGEGDFRCRRGRCCDTDDYHRKRTDSSWPEPHSFWANMEGYRNCSSKKWSERYHMESPLTLPVVIHVLAAQKAVRNFFSLCIMLFEQEKK